MLTCDPEPIVPAVVATDDDGAQWAEMVRSAGANCRAQLETLRVYVATWPK
jgi:hypothetical protein